MSLLHLPHQLPLLPQHLAIKKEVQSAPKPAIKKKVSKPTAPKKIAHNSDSDSTNKSNSTTTATTDAWSGRLRSRMPAAPKN